MNLTDYIRLVMPAEGNGFYCVSILKDDKFFNKHFSTVDETAQFLQRVNKTTPHNAYLACNTFQTADNRKQINAQSAQSLFVDLDVGPTKPYASQREAVDALKQFCADSGFRFPVVLSSGNGIYAVWPLSQPITSVVWTNVSTLLRSIFDNYKISYDPSKINDSSMVLRPHGTHNKKDQDNYKPVQLVASTLKTYNPITPKELVSMLSTAMKRSGATLGLAKKTKTDAYNNFSTLEEQRPFNIAKAAMKCAQLSMLRDTHGNVDEPLWYAGLGVAAYADDPQAIHTYSNGHPDYDHEATETKAEQWRARTTGATTCKKFNQLNPSLCSTCPFLGKITSPVKLGYADPTPLEAPKIHNVAYEEPNGFKRTEQGLQLRVDDEWITFYPYDVYPISVALDTGTGTEVATFRHKLPHEGYVEVQFETRLLADSKKFHEMLLNNGISILSQDNLVRMKFYMGGYLERIRANRARDTLYSTMGWKDLHGEDPYFVIGDTAICSSGEHKIIGVSRSAPEIIKAFSTRGEEDAALKGFATISKLYDYVGMEPLAFALLCEIGAPLMQFTGLSGATVSLVGQSGNGKTLTSKLGLSAYGDPYKLIVLAKDSEKFASKRFGTYCNLPVVIDEITNVADTAISDLLYDVTNGRDRGTLKRDRSEREGQRWCTLGVVTTNEFLSSKLMFKANATAELNRLIELPVPRRTAIDQARGRAIDKFIRHNHGHVGRKFLSLLAKNHDKMPRLIESALERVETMYQARSDERFATTVAAVAYATGDLLKSLGLINFDHKRVLAWAMKQICKERSTRDEMVAHPGDALARFVSENVSSTLLIGYIENPGRGVNAFHLNPSANPSKIFMRYNYRFDKPEESTLMISVPAFSEWVSKTMRMDVRQVKEWLQEQGYFTGRSSGGRVYRQSLGTQTMHKLPSVPTWALRLQAVGTDIAENGISKIVQSDPLFGDAVREIKRRLAARKIASPFDPAVILDSVEVEAEL